MLSFKNSMVGVIALTSIAFSATTAMSASCPKTGGILKYGVKAEPPTYDMHGTNSYAVNHYVAQHYSTLLTFDWKKFPKLEGDIADSWTQSSDGLTYTFKLKKGIKFHDGTPLTSADVKMSYERMKSPPEGVISVRKALFGPISTISAPDAHTVVFKLSKPDAFMMDGFASPFNVIYSVKDMKKDPKWHIKNINGTGPYKFAGHRSGEAWKAVKYEGFHHGDNCLDGTEGYRIKKLAEPLIGGQIDTELRGTAPPERVMLSKEMGDKVTYQAKTLMTLWVVSLNSKTKAFQNPKVRQALNMCIDRHAGLKTLAKITFVAPRPSGYLLYGTEYALPDEELYKIPGFTKDIASSRKEAMKMLKEAGAEGLEFTYNNRTVSHPYDHIAIWLMSEWKKCGLNPKMTSNPTSKFVKARRDGGFDASIDWAPSFLPDPTLMHFKYISADRTSSNYSQYIDRELDALFDAQGGETDIAKRKAIVHKFEKRALNNAWVLPVTYTDRVIALNSKVKGYTIAYSHILNNTWRGVYLDQ
ncbi:MAG: ABC transporter substrate-binding protein [Proteobacteria bacterium]|nr:ABC transporter substrate-binding protein [Pseudomonadota bacterium]MDA1136791.1 ABC transporter substrate-binding protein [Pseudomonadota bacterium]